MDFIWMYAISLPRHILGPAWKTGYLNGLSVQNTPSSPIYRSGLNSSQSAPQMSSTRPIANAE